MYSVTDRAIIDYLLTRKARHLYGSCVQDYIILFYYDFNVDLSY